MKKIIIIFWIFIMQSSIHAQSIENGDFENWNSLPGIPNVEDPVHWTSNNIATSIVNIPGISKTNDSYSGNYALKITPIIADSENSMAASICLGVGIVDTITYSLDFSHTGDSISYIPEKLTGYYKYSPDSISNDSAIAFVVISSLQAQLWAMDPPAYGTYSFTPEADFTYFEIPLEVLNYDVEPDTIAILFHYYSENTSNSPIGQLIVDNLNIEGVLNISDNINELISIFPNPSSGSIIIKIPDNVRINSLFLQDLSGRIIKSFRSNQSIINVSDIPKGNYLLCFKTDMGNYSKKIVIE